MTVRGLVWMKALDRHARHSLQPFEARNLALRQR